MLGHGEALFIDSDEGIFAHQQRVVEAITRVLLLDTQTSQRDEAVAGVLKESGVGQLEGRMLHAFAVSDAQRLSTVS